MSRIDGRDHDQLRPVKMTPHFIPAAEGSCLVQMGDTHVICTATVEEGVPRWMKGRGWGWVTAEYSMLPRSSPQRIAREVNRGRVSGRTQEIQRLIGRSLRAVTDLTVMGEWSILIDCDVLRADGGTRTASITGGYVALAQAVAWMRETEKLQTDPLHTSVAAVSVGILEGKPALDLNYEEDSTADVDMNVVMTGDGRFVEVQGTAEKGVFDRDALDDLVDLAATGIEQLIKAQQDALNA